MKPEVLLLTLGGTIAMVPGAGAGATPQLSSQDLIASVPQLAAIADIQSLALRQLPGAHLSFNDIDAVAHAIRDADGRGVRGVVVVQGTDTIEETAFALDRLLDVELPVIVTGAMRTAVTPGADGPANLLAAVRVASCNEARGLGCLVVMNDEIHAARFVRKTHTSHPGAFASPLAGPLGWVVEDRVRILHRPAGVARTTSAMASAPVRVALLTACLGDDGVVVDALCDRVNGIVVQAMGGGHVAPDLADALERAARQIPVVLASRCLGGEVLAQTYGFAGGEIDLRRRGLCSAGWLDGIKARVLLTLVLRARDGRADATMIARAFEPWGGGARNR
jgi:L-asparaginase